MGTLLVIEGLDGSGKATQASALAGYYRECGRKTLHISFPNYGSESSALVRQYLSGALGDREAVNAYAASSFYAADRFISFQRGWKKQYDEGYTIVADRYATSNYAYQMSKLPEAEWDEYLEWMQEYEYIKLDLPQPNTVVYLDMDPAASLMLLEKRYGDEPVLAARGREKRDLDYLLRCRKAALYACSKLGWRTVNCSSGGKPLPILQILEQVKLMTIDV